MTTYFVGYYTDKDKTEAVAKRLEGKSYMNFQTCVYPAGGCLGFTVSTTKDVTEEELKEMIISVMISDQILSL